MGLKSSPQDKARPAFQHCAAIMPHKGRWFQWVLILGFTKGVLCQAPAPSYSARPLNGSSLHFPTEVPLAIYPGVTFTGDSGCSPSGLRSYLTIDNQVVPVEEQTHFALRVIQAPNTGVNTVPDNVVWLDLQTGSIVTGIPKLNWTQQATVFNYTLLSPGLVDLAAYRKTLDTLITTVTGLTQGSQSSSPRYRCATSNPVLQPLVDYLGEIQDSIANASNIDTGLKKGIEYRVPAGCIIELDALYAGNDVGSPNLQQAATKQPTEDDCCQACKSQQGCNVFSFCPSFEGCLYASQSVPAFNCQLKFLANISSDPTVFPTALARGPPVSFKSGRFG